MVDPILRSSPVFEVGMPALRANCCFTLVMPNARFHEKERPGIEFNFILMFNRYNKCLFWTILLLKPRLRTLTW